jgi:hypothetical protein
MLHLVFAMKKDQVGFSLAMSRISNMRGQELGREFVKFMKGCEKLAPFVIALALSCARVPRLEETVYDLLKV